MSTTPFSVTSNETYTMFDVFVKDAEGDSKEYGFQCGGGRMTAEQAARHIEKFNLYPGAQEVTVRPTLSPIPQMSIEKRVQQAAKAGLKSKVFTTPKVKAFDAPLKRDPIKVAEADLTQEERTAIGDPIPEVEVLPTKKK